MLHVHDLVDWVSQEAEIAGKSAALHALGKLPPVDDYRTVTAGDGVRYVLPQKLSPPAGQPSVRFYMRASRPMGASVLRLHADDHVVWEVKHRVVKPSEMIVADVLGKNIGSAREIAFTVAPAPDERRRRRRTGDGGGGMTRRVQPIQCIGCPTGCGGEVIMEDGAVVELSGFTCDVGRAYAAEEVVAPKRMVTTTVRVEGGALPLLPVVSDRPIPKGSIFACLRLLRGVTVTAPVAADSVVLADALGLGVNFRASRDCASFDSPPWVETDGQSASLSETDDAALALEPSAAAELADNDSAPWHDPSLPLSERMAMAESKPPAPRLMAAMAQQDCGQCGYDCADYANALFLRKEERLTLCEPGGKETARVLKSSWRRWAQTSPRLRS